MILAPHHPTRHDEHGFFDGPHADARVGLTLLASLAAIALAVTLFAVAGTHLGLGPRLEPVAYLFLGLSAAVLVSTYLLTFLRNEMRAALYMVAFWALTLTGIYGLFYAFG